MDLKTTITKMVSCQLPTVPDLEQQLSRQASSADTLMVSCSSDHKSVTGGNTDVPPAKDTSNLSMGVITHSVAVGCQTYPDVATSWRLVLILYLLERQLLIYLNQLKPISLNPA